MTAAARPSLTLTLTPPQTDTHSLHADKTRRKEGREGGREEHAVSGGITKRSCTAQDCFALSLPCTPFHTLPLLVILSPHPSHRLGRSLSPASRGPSLASQFGLFFFVPLSVPVSAGTCKIDWLCCHALGLELNQLRVEWRSTDTARGKHSKHPTVTVPRNDWTWQLIFWEFY